MSSELHGIPATMTVLQHFFIFTHWILLLQSAEIRCFFKKNESVKIFLKWFQCERDINTVCFFILIFNLVTQGNNNAGPL